MPDLQNESPEQLDQLLEDTKRSEDPVIVLDEPADGCKWKITQNILKYILRVTELSRKVQVLQRQLKHALANGAIAEPGPCTVELRKGKIAAGIPKAFVKALALTAEQIANLKQSLGDREFEYLDIREYGEKHSFEV